MSTARWLSIARPQVRLGWHRCWGYRITHRLQPGHALPWRHQNPKPSGQCPGARFTPPPLRRLATAPRRVQSLGPGANARLRQTDTGEGAAASPPCPLTNLPTNRLRPATGKQTDDLLAARRACNVQRCLCWEGLTCAVKAWHRGSPNKLGGGGRPQPDRAT